MARWERPARQKLVQTIRDNGDGTMTVRWDKVQRRYLVERREVLAQNTRVHYHAGAPGGIARWVPDQKDAESYPYGEARTIAGHGNRMAKRARLYNLFYKAIPLSQD